MKEDPLWARIALLSNLVGTILLALSFSATSSDFRMVTATGYDVDGQVNPIAKTYALCVNGYTLLATDSLNRVVMGSAGCPDVNHSRAVAVVNTEHPSFIFVGLFLSALGFAVQFFIVPRRKNLSEVNEELRMLRKQKRLLQIADERKKDGSPPTD